MQWGDVLVPLYWPEVADPASVFHGEVPEAFGHTHIRKVCPSHTDDHFPAVFDKAILGLATSRSPADRDPVGKKKTVDGTPQEFKVEVTL